LVKNLEEQGDAIHDPILNDQLSLSFKKEGNVVFVKGVRMIRKDTTNPVELAELNEFFKLRQKQGTLLIINDYTWEDDWCYIHVVRKITDLTSGVEQIYQDVKQFVHQAVDYLQIDHELFEPYVARLTLALLPPDQKHLFNCEYTTADMDNVDKMITGREYLFYNLPIGPPSSAYEENNPYGFQNHFSKMEFNGKEFPKDDPDVLQKLFEEMKSVYEITHTFHDDHVILSTLATYLH